MLRIPAFRRTKALTYSFFILLVLGVFLLGYFYYYLPTNRQRIHKEGFGVLRTIAGNIADKNTDRRNLYKNFISETQRQRPAAPNNYVQELLRKNNVEGSAQYVVRSAVRRNRRPVGSPARLTIHGEQLVYTAGLGRHELVVSEDIADFLAPILLSQRAELFDSYALASVDGSGSKLLYHDDELGIRSDVRLDTLLARTVEGYLTGVRDLDAPEFNHKIFYYPFRLGSIQLVLCGFARLDTYHQSVNKVPFHFVYPLSITFLLLLVFLPALKFYVMDANEQLRVSDVIWFGLSVFVGASVLTLIVVQYLLWQGEEENARQNLKELSKQIETSFIAELNQAYEQMDTLDAFRRADAVSLNRRIRNDTTVDYSASIRRLVKSLRHSPNCYYHFDRISWVEYGAGDRGQQVIKAEMTGGKGEKAKPVFTNVNNRQYFRAFRDNEPFTLPSPGNASFPSKPFGWEPIYSQTNADFNVTISKLSLDQRYVVALATKMSSVVHTLLPVGYGFCLIDGAGKVLLHSNVSRNLRENFFQKVHPAADIQGLVVTRQDADIDEVALYRTWYRLHIRPVRNLPYALVTFYDKGFMVPVNLRILIFAFLFNALAGLTCGLLWLALARTGLHEHPLLYSPMDGLTWLIPQQRQAGFYGHGLGFLAAYGLALVTFNSLPGVNDYGQFSTVLFTPVNVIGGLYVTGALYRRLAGKAPAQWTLLRVPIVHGVLSGAFWLLSDWADYAIGWAFVGFQLAIIGLPFVLFWGRMAFRGGRAPSGSANHAEHYRVRYSVLMTGLVVCLAVLPSALFSWYGYEQERIQTVKKQQLHLASDIRQRSSQLLNLAGFADSALVADAYVDDRFIRQGIYTINHDRLAWQPHPTADTVPDSFDRFYFLISEKLSNRYYDPKGYPALADRAADQSWHWRVRGDSVHLTYHNPVQQRATDGNRQRCLYVESVLPPPFLLDSHRGVWSMLLLTLLSSVLLWGLYRWLYVYTGGVFLLKYVHPDKPEHTGINKLMARYRAYVADGSEDPRVCRPAAYNYYTPDRSEEKLATYEREVLQVIRRGRPFYQQLWDHLTDKEKYLLYDFAHDGLLNFKNTKEIYHLMGRGLLIVLDERLRLINPAFRAFVVNKADTDEVRQLHTRYRQDSTWQSLRGPLFLLLIGFVSFVFFTQEAAFNKVLALAAGIGSLLSTLPKLFDNGSKPPPATGSGAA